jgi:hypothetical protein
VHHVLALLHHALTLTRLFAQSLDR